jgi:hypothetical protein
MKGIKKRACAREAFLFQQQEKKEIRNCQSAAAMI